MFGDGDPSGLVGVRVLAVASALRVESPSVLAEYLLDFLEPHTPYHTHYAYYRQALDMAKATISRMLNSQ